MAPWVDAQRGEVFAALYERGGCQAMGEPTALTPAATLASIDAAGRRVRFIGDGAVRYADAIMADLGREPSSIGSCRAWRFRLR